MASNFKVFSLAARACSRRQLARWTPARIAGYTRALQTTDSPYFHLPEDRLPDPHNPAENPLAVLGDEELTDVKKYWRKRQSETPSPVYVREVSDEGIAYGIGKRKASVARVEIRLSGGNHSITVNGKDWVDYFPRIDHRDQILRPLLTVSESKGSAFSINCDVFGGGITGQAEAFRHGLARALVKWDPSDRSVLKKDGLLTRDSRVVESKKYGRKKARKAFTWVKR